MVYCSDCEISQEKTEEPSCYEDSILVHFNGQISQPLQATCSSVFLYIQSKPLLFQTVPSVWLDRVIGLAEGVSRCCEDTVCTSRQSAIKELSVPNLAVAPEIREAQAC